ncbi:MAG: transglutaminase domain-containing protein [Chitinophagaceae bacterium]|nr:transglutaminase domain-containing protein [Chitinophagaceae bacterium]
MKTWFYVVGFGLMLLFGNSCTSPTHRTMTPAQETALYYLYNRSLLSDTLARILWRIPVDFRGYDPEEKQLYFLFKRDVGRAKVLTALCLDTSKVEFAPCERGPCEFGGMSGNIDGYYVFRMPEQNLKVDSNRAMNCLLKDYPLQLSLKELSRLRDSSITYNTPPYMDLTKFTGYQVKCGNIGSYISQGGKDEFIKRLADQLTSDVKTPEEKYARLLDFVTQKILYSFEDYWYEAEITKRAHEVVFSGEADCSGKSTLYASLLEALNLPYCLIYFEHHMNVGVPGNFPAENGYQIDLEGTRYFMAETTVPGFQIGISRLSNAEILEHPAFYQIPKKSEAVLEVGGNKRVPLIFEEEESPEEE